MGGFLGNPQGHAWEHLWEILWRLMFVIPKVMLIVIYREPVGFLRMSWEFLRVILRSIPRKSYGGIPRIS